MHELNSKAVIKRMITLCWSILAICFIIKVFGGNWFEIAAANKVKELICDVDCELKAVERLYIKLNQINWDISMWVTCCDEEMHDYYAQKTKEIGIDIC